MAAPKMSGTTISLWLGILLGSITVTVYARGYLDKKIDERCQYNNRYITILLKEIATPEQKERADKEFQRWNNQ